LSYCERCVLGGYYHGKLVFPREFPFKPPSIYMITPSGRFAVNTRFSYCLVFYCINDCSYSSWQLFFRLRTETT